MSFLRRIRAAVGLGLAWAVVWGVAGAMASPLLGRFANAGGSPTSIAVVFAITIGWYGFLAGVVFSVVLAVAGRRRSFDSLRTSTIGLWGLAASVLLTAPPFMLMVAARGWRVEDAVYTAGSLLLSAGCAIGSLLLARRALPNPSSSGELASGVPLAYSAADSHDRVIR